MKTFTRRERALIQHARRRAVDNHVLRVVMMDARRRKLTMREITLGQLRRMNSFLHCIPGERQLSVLIFDQPIMADLQWMHWPDGFDPMI